MMKKHEFSKEQRCLIEGLRQPYAVCQFLDKKIVTLAASEGFFKLFGYENREEIYSAMIQNLLRDAHPEDTAGCKNKVLKFYTDGGRLNLVFRFRKKEDPCYRMIRLTGEAENCEDGVSLAHLWFTDEGEYREEGGDDLNQAVLQASRKESLENASYFDYLTGLPNMSYFFELAEIGRKKMLDQDMNPALLYIDLAGMKHYNHTHGFAEGDIMLKYFAQLLSKTFHADRCSHINADRFAAVSEESELEEKIETLFQEWKEMGEDRFLPIRIGIYRNRFEEVPVGMAYDRAKIACDALKGTYVSSFRYYNNELDEEIEKQQYILDNFDKALSENWIQVFYQPIIRAINGEVCDEEALARWIDPVKGFLSPADFIPFLEEAGLIYKLDLRVLELVLENIKTKEAEGFYIVPHSINLSRSDFDACDMVEEIRSRVDAAGVRRDRICIEITESIIGSSVDFIKEQVERFQALGFPVWMDDFGSGYSSLDVLQSIKFNLLKFDMGFMRKLDENDDGRVILTELMKMALALGVDTICEGVETEEQVHFLQEIGCSKLQGFFFSKPRSMEEALEIHRSRQTSYEDPAESGYYELLCGVNLYDVSVIAREEKTSLQNTYTTLPMCIVEIKGDSSRFIRTNQSYRDFFHRSFRIDLAEQETAYFKYGTSFMNNVVKTCSEQGGRTFYDEKMPDGSIVHSFARRLGVNPVTGNIAIAIAVLSIREPNEKLMVEQILSVIEQFGEFIPGGFFIYNADEKEELLYANKAVFDIFGCEGIEDFKALTGFTFRGMVHPDDYDRISGSILDQIRESEWDLDFVEYRIIRKDGEVRWLDDYGHYIEYDDKTSMYYVFISDITDKYEKAESDKALRSAVIEALTKSYDSVWLINDIKNEKFELFRIDREMEHFLPANVAVKIEKFSDALTFYSRLVFEEDRERFLESVTPEKIEKNTENRMIYSVPYRRVFEERLRYYRLEFTRLDLPDGKTGIVGGFRNVDEEVLKEQQIQHSLDQRAAVIEALTRPYDSVWLINDIKTQQFELYRIDEKLAHIMPAQEALKIVRFSDAFAFYSKLVLEEDREGFLSGVSPESILKGTENRMIYSVPFRRVFEDGVRNYRIEFTRMELENGETKIVAGFKDASEYK